MFHVIFRALITDAPFGRRRPVALDAQSFGADGHRMRRGQAPNVAESGGGSVAVDAKEQKIADRGVVQLVGNFRMLTQTVQRVAEKKALSQLGIIERLYSEMIARAKQQFLARVPYGERKIPAQMLHAFRAPGRIRAQDQVGVRGHAAIGAAALQRELLLQFLAAINARIRGDPQLAIETRRLPLDLRFARSAQHGVAQANRAVRPGVTAVRSALRQKMSERLQQPALHRRATAIVDAHDAAQSVRASRGEIGPSNGTKCRCSLLVSFSTAQSTSTHACASKRSNSLRAPMRSSAAIPRRRSSHHSTSDCSRQFVAKKTFRAAAAAMRAITSADCLCDAPRRCMVVFAEGASLTSTLCQRRKPASRKPSHVAKSPAAASSAMPRS